MSKKLQLVGGFNLPVPDWNQTDETQSDYIKNKPKILYGTALSFENVRKFFPNGKEADQAFQDALNEHLANNDGSYDSKYDVNNDGLNNVDDLLCIIIWISDRSINATIDGANVGDYYFTDDGCTFVCTANNKWRFISSTDVSVLEHTHGLTDNIASLQNIESQFIALNDVSSVNHKISVSLEGTDVSVTDETEITVTACGKNIIDPPWASSDPYITNGITFDTQDDHSITITGQATENAYFKFEINKKLVSGTYTLKVFADNDCITNGCVVPTMNKFDVSNKSTYMGADVGNGYTFTVTQEDSETYTYGLHFTIVASKNYNFTGERFYTMLVLGDVAPTEYEQHIGTTVTTTIANMPIGINAIAPVTNIFVNTPNVVINEVKYLKDTAVSHPEATEFIPGLMSADDKSTLNTIAKDYVTRAEFEAALGALQSELAQIASTMSEI